MKKLLTTVAMVATLSTQAWSGMIADLRAGGGMTNFVSPWGKIGTSVATVSLEKEDGLGLKPLLASYYGWAEFDHLIPIIPNVRVEHESMPFTGEGTFTLTFFGQSVSGATTSSLNLTNSDYIAYWGVPFVGLIPFVEMVDFGLGAKLYNGALTMDSAGQDVSETVPLMAVYGYLRGRVGLPMGIGVEADMKTLPLDMIGVVFTEFTVKADWMLELPVPVLELKGGFEAGYKQTLMDIDITASGNSFVSQLNYNKFFAGFVGKFGI
jgi:outer membrane protein